MLGVSDSNIGEFIKEVKILRPQSLQNPGVDLGVSVQVELTKRGKEIFGLGNEMDQADFDKLVGNWLRAQELAVEDTRVAQGEPVGVRVLLSYGLDLPVQQRKGIAKAADAGFDELFAEIDPSAGKEAGLRSAKLTVEKINRQLAVNERVA